MITEHDYDVVIIGGGPAGLTASINLRKYDLKVALIDERRTLGGQIYKRVGSGFKINTEEYLGKDFLFGSKLINKFETCGATTFLETTVITIENGKVIAANNDSGTLALSFKKLVVATGAYDRPVAFPGWTLPGVITAGAAQTLVKSQQFSPGSNMVFAGSGPLALAFPAQMTQLGAPVKLVLEAASAPSILDGLNLLSALKGNLDLIKDAIRYRTTLIKNRIPFKYKRIVVSAEGNSRVERITYAKVNRNWEPIPGTEKTISADTLIIGYGFMPSIELLKLLDCKMGFNDNRGGFTAITDKWGATSIADVFAVGDGTGVSGSYVAKAQAELAALKIAQELGKIELTELNRVSIKAFQELRQRIKFQEKIGQMFKVGSGIYKLADSETIICRCESVKLSDLTPIINSSIDLSVAKAYSRAGMGLCQGRNCQRHIAAMIAQKHNIDIADVPTATPRFPIKPVAIGLISDDSVTEQKYFFNE